MIRTIFIYGIIAGLAVICPMTLSIALSGGEGLFSSQTLGFLIMLVGLSLVFVAVKRHRDNVLGGVIKFFPALGMGLAIVAVAGVAYVIVWEIYLAVTDYAFAEQYIAAQIEAIEARDMEPEARERALAGLEQARALYASPLLRPLITFTEILPVGAIIAVVSAALLRNPNFARKK